MSGAPLATARGRASSISKHQSPYDCGREDSHSKSERDDAYPAPLKFSGVISPPLIG